MRADLLGQLYDSESMNEPPNAELVDLEIAAFELWREQAEDPDVDVFLQSRDMPVDAEREFREHWNREQAVATAIFEAAGDTQMNPIDDLPQMLGRFELRRFLGGGGFGNVYLAHDTKLDRIVACKILHQTSGALVFQNEGKSAASVNHDCIVTIYDETWINGRHVIVEEYIEGDDLATWASSTQPSYIKVARLMEDVADALCFLHAKGTKHCDLKPQNIIVDGNDRPHITDFGLAAREEHQSLLPSVPFGTPTHMAPEQVAGETHHCDGRLDIWACGVILFELLTGRLPFSAAEREELFDQIRHRSLTPPRQFKPDVPRRLEVICSKCLEKNPRDRFQSAMDLKKALRRYVSLQQLSPYYRIAAGLLAIALGMSFVALRTRSGIDKTSERSERFGSQIDDNTTTFPKVGPRGNAKLLDAQSKDSETQSEALAIDQALAGNFDRLATIANDQTQRCSLIRTMQARKDFFASPEVATEVRADPVCDGWTRSAIALSAATGLRGSDGHVLREWKLTFDRWLKQPDSGSHSAAKFALERLGLELPSLEASITRLPPGDRNWWLAPSGLTMIRIPGGTLRRRKQPDEEILSFWIADCEISAALYERIMTGDRLDDPLPIRDVDLKTNAFSFCNRLNAAHQLRPTYEHVLNDDATLAHPRRGFRLPTPEEWMYACANGTALVPQGLWTRNFGSHAVEFVMGTQSADRYLGDYAVFDQKIAQPKPCRSRMCSPWGLFDMHGNVEEWSCRRSTRVETAQLVHGGKFSTKSPELLKATRLTTKDPHGMDITKADVDRGFRVAFSTRD